jgi:hypothetical protein
MGGKMMLKKILTGFVILSFLSVADYLTTQNVDSVRIVTEGYGKSQPIADNDTVGGRAQNCRVEVAIWANEKLKKVAKETTS